MTQVSGLLSLLQDLRNNAVPTREAHGDAWAMRALGVEAEGQTSAEFMIVAGDFNFNRSSAGYSRLVEDGGLAAAYPRPVPPEHDGDASSPEGTLDARLSHAESRRKRRSSSSPVPVPAPALPNTLVDKESTGTFPLGITVKPELDDEGTAEALGQDLRLRRAGSTLGAMLVSVPVTGMAPAPLGQLGHSTDGRGLRLAAGKPRNHDEEAAAAAAAVESGAPRLPRMSPEEETMDADDDGALDFVFFTPTESVSCTSYRVHREFSQERYADGYPSVTDFEVMELLQ